MSRFHPEYVQFIRGERWLNSRARQAELRASGHRCRLCGRGRPEVRIEVHHRTYARLGRERTWDLCTLCDECHEVVTDMLRRRRHILWVPPVRDVAAPCPARRLVDSTLEGKRCPMMS
jgi:5-methylcytosine-specific restriction endonuclease McrA